MLYLLKVKSDKCMKALKWSFNIILLVIILRVFAKETIAYQMIAPVTEPLFEMLFSQLGKLLEDNQSTALREVFKEQELDKEKEEEKEDSKTYNSEKNNDDADYSRVQEFDEVMPCQSKISYVTHQRSWQDLKNRSYKAKVTILPKIACEAESFREKLPEPISDGSVGDYYGKVYLQLVKDNKDKMDKIYDSFERVRVKYKLNRRQFAEVVVSYVQSIPYVLVHPESCQKARKWGGFFEEYHNDGKECLPDVRFGLTSPAEFIYNLKGDCDTRSVFLYTILSHFGYDVAVFVSQTHCVLGINLPAQGDYIAHKGKKYYFWETTAQGYAMGVMAPSFKNELWQIALVKTSKS